MMSTDRLKRLVVGGNGKLCSSNRLFAAAPRFFIGARAPRPARVLAALLLVGSELGCRGEPADMRAPAPEEQVPAGAEHPASAVVDLGSDDGPRQLVEGFSLPERVGARLASWSEGELSTVAMNLRGGAGDYRVAFLAEPYHRLGTVGVSLALNGRPLGEAELTKGWRAYQLPVSGDRVVAGRNVLSFQYSKTGRPSDFEPQSTDVRSLSVRFDQIELAPISERARLAFGSKNALALAALGDGWARDPSDRGTGTWTIAKRAQLTFHLVAPGTEPGPGYRLTLTARAPQGVLERKVVLTLNGAPLGSLVFAATKTAASLDVPAERLRAENELWLEFDRLESPAQLDAESKDKRPLGLRVFGLDIGPNDPSGQAPTQPEAAGKEPVAEAAALN
jgi:hypothetical protein